MSVRMFQRSSAGSGERGLNDGTELSPAPVLSDDKTSEANFTQAGNV